MVWLADRAVEAVANTRRGTVVVAGPGSNQTLPGIIVSEVVRALAKTGTVMRVEVDDAPGVGAGLHRAPSLSAALEPGRHRVVRVETLGAPWRRTATFRNLIGSDVATAVAYAWPGIDNEWIPPFLRAASLAGATTLVACASLPDGRPPVRSLVEVLDWADRVFVGDISDATELATLLGPRGPKVEAHPALSLRGKAPLPSARQITAFLQRDYGESLTALLTAFDAIPEAWVESYALNVVMRHGGSPVTDRVAESHHARHVALIDGDISTDDLARLCVSSSVLSVASPTRNSRAFATAVDSGVATVVIDANERPNVERGYVGGFWADVRRPASIHVALNHALRLEELRFPGPDAWDRFAQRLRPARSAQASAGRGSPVFDQ